MRLQRHIPATVYFVDLIWPDLIADDKQNSNETVTSGTERDEEGQQQPEREGTSRRRSCGCHNYN